MIYSLYLIAAVVVTLDVLYLKVIRQLQAFSNRISRSCKISTDKHVARSLCNLHLHKPVLTAKSSNGG